MSYRINELKVMFGSRDFETRNKEEITYMHWRDDFNDFVKKRNLEGSPGGNIEATWLYEMLDYQHHPCNRVMAALPLVVYEVKNNKLTEAMEDELYGTKEDFDEGLLDQLPIEELDEIKKDLEFCFSRLKK